MYKRLGTYYTQHIARTQSAGPPLLPPIVQVLVRGVVAALMGTLTSRLLATVNGILVVRYFSNVALFGQYTTVTTTLALLASLLGFGLDTWLLREGGRDHTTLFRNVQQVLLIKLLSGTVMIVALALIWSQTQLNWLVFVGVLSIMIDSCAQSGYAMLRALQRNRTVAIFQTASASLAVLALVVLFQFPERSVTALMLSQMGSSTLMALLLALNVRHLWQPTPLEFHVWQVVKGAWFFFISDVLANIYTQVSVAILILYMDVTQVGTFRLAQSVISMGFLAPLMLFYVALPIMSKPDLQQRERRNLITMMIVASSVYGVLVALGIWIVGKPILHLMYGTKYDSVVPFLEQMSFVPLFKAWSFVAVAILLSRNGQRQRVLLQGVIVLLSIIGGFAIIPMYGIIGASWLYIVIEGLLCILYSIGAYRSLRQQSL